MLVSLERQARLARFARQEDAIRSLVAELLVRQAIGFHRQIPSSQINFDSNTFGKPILREDPSFHFNISHSGDWVLCAISEAVVGIDIEKIVSIDLQIAKNYFTEVEQRYVFASETNNNQKLNRFYEIWTVKESYIKAIGEGLSISLQSFSVLNDQLEKCYPLQKNSIQSIYYLQQFELDPLYKCAVCGKLPISIELIKVMDAECFFNSLNNKPSKSL